MKKTFLLLLILTLGSQSMAAQFDGSIAEWKSEKESFKKPEESFNKALQTLKEKYADKNITEEDLYRAATAGMLAALNTGKENWNTLIIPRDMKDVNIEASGQLVGIGATLDFDANEGNARVRGVIPGSAGEKAGLRRLDQILGVNGKRYKDLRIMVEAIRGKEGDSVKLKVLREDRILDMTVVRAAVKIPLTQAVNIDTQTGYLEISGFTKNAQKDIKKLLPVLSEHKLQKLIIDLRGNKGGVFDQALDVADLFLNKDDIIVMAQSRDGSKKEFKAKGPAWSPETKIVILTSKETSSSAEFFAESLRENRKAVILGDETAGKWTVESLESLPNDYYIKYSVMSLQSPSGKNYEGKGISPDYAFIKYVPQELVGYDFTKDIKKSIETDPTLKAAVELPVR